jgi:flagellar export protein FliJ
MKFKFPYDNILKTKKVSRDVAYREFADARGRLTKAEQNLDAMKLAVTEAHGASEDLMNENLTDRERVELLKWTQVFQDGQKIKMNRQKAEIQIKSQETEDRRDTLAQAGKEFKIFEKLKDRMKEKYKKRLRKLDQKSTDEIVVMQTARKLIEKK